VMAPTQTKPGDRNQIIILGKGKRIKTAVKQKKTGRPDVLIRKVNDCLKRKKKNGRRYPGWKREKKEAQNAKHGLTKGAKKRILYPV